MEKIQNEKIMCKVHEKGINQKGEVLKVKSTANV